MGRQSHTVRERLAFKFFAGKNEVTLINTVPSVWLSCWRWVSLPDSVLTVNLAGEPLRSELVKEIYECGNVEKVYDLYGPSETTTYSTFTLRTAEGPPTIGRPISNTRIYILDGNLQPVPIGVPGELYIGGAGVARGYLNRPDLTAERFISSSFNANGCERIYRTGDLARYRPDGDIEFLGRADNQVKIHGYRIELGEIEAVLTKHPTVKDCVVVVCERESQSGKNLVGYVVPREHSVLSVTELRSYLKEKLPEYMIPSSFVLLEALPLMPNGKVDRNTLPPPDGTRPPLTEEFVAPRTEIEELVAQTWREVLKIENVGIYDNFFELGGHSLLATQIVARLQEAFNKDVPLRVLFDAPTIAELAQELETIIRDGRAPDLPPIVPVPRDGPLPLSMNQEHLWRLDQAIPGTHFFNMPYVYRLSGDLNIGALEKAVGEMIRRHEALRTVFVEANGAPRQVIQPAPDYHLPLTDLRNASPSDAAQKAADLVVEETESPFDLAVGPLLRVKLLRLTDSECLLLITMHHIVSDQWSMQVFRRELVTLYNAFSKGRPSPLPELPIQFADFACWERQLLAGGLLNGQFNYWKKQLASPLPELELRESREPKKQIRFRTASQKIEFGEELWLGVKALARKEQVTPFMIILTALNIAIHVHTKRQDIIVGTLMANRRSRTTEGTIGHFLNTVFLRTRVEPNIRFQELLYQARKIFLEAYGNQELPFAALAPTTLEDGNLRKASQFKVMLSYKLSPLVTEDPIGLTIAPVSWELDSSEAELAPTSFDLIVQLRQTSTKATGSVNYKTDILEAREANRMLESLNQYLRKITLDSRDHVASDLPSN